MRRALLGVALAALLVPAGAAAHATLKYASPGEQSRVDAPPTEIFSGWMFASSPGVSALEHAVYDLVVVDCEEPIEAPQPGQGDTEATPPASE